MASRTWTGAAGNNDMNDPANYVEGIAPVPGDCLYISIEAHAVLTALYGETPADEPHIVNG